MGAFEIAEVISNQLRAYFKRRTPNQLRALLYYLCLLSLVTYYLNYYKWFHRMASLNSEANLNFISLYRFLKIVKKGISLIMVICYPQVLNDRFERRTRYSRRNNFSRKRSNPIRQKSYWSTLQKATSKFQDNSCLRSGNVLPSLTT